EVIAALQPPRVCWAMVPAGKITEELVNSLAARMQKGDIIIDGGNSNFKDSQRRAKELAERGIHFCDAGTSGGIWGPKGGYWLLDLWLGGSGQGPGHDGVRGYVEERGEGRWTVQAAIDQNVPAPVITLSLLMRVASRQDESFSAKVQAALRSEFGGHAVKKS